MCRPTTLLKHKKTPFTENFLRERCFPYNIPLLLRMPTSTTMTSAATQTPIKMSMYFSGTFGEILIEILKGVQLAAVGAVRVSVQSSQG